MIERPHEVVYGEVETPTCGPGDVLVRSRFAGLCRTDVEVLEGELDLRWVRYRASRDTSGAGWWRR